MTVPAPVAPHVAARLRQDLASVAARIGLRSEEHVRDVLDAAERAMVQRGRVDLERYVDALVTGAETSDAWIEEVVVQETYFFRDLVQLDWVSRNVLAPLAAAPTSADGRVSIWSAGCASGEETYTLAAMALEMGLARSARILGTDVSAESIRRARLATYGDFSLRGAHGERMRPYLESVAGRHRVRSEVRAMVDLRRGNLASRADSGDPPPGSVALILCRNVLLYFAPEAIASAAARFERALAPGGLVVTAPADPPLADVAGWSRVPGAVGVYRRCGDEPADAWPASWALPPALPAPPPSTRARPAPASTQPPPSVAFEPAAAAPVEEERAVWHHHRHALSLLEAGDVAGALTAARKVTYLAPDLAMGHFTLALVALRSGSVDIARRSYREAARLARRVAPTDALLLGDGLRAEEIARSCARQLARLEGR